MSFQIQRGGWSVQARGADPFRSYGSIIQETVLPARSYLTFELRTGQVVRIIDLEGQQVADMVFFNLNKLAEKFSPNNTVTLNGNVYLSNGGKLYSDQANVMCSLVADTVGRHDFIAGSCSEGTNRLRYGEQAIGKATCRGNLTLALSPHGIAMKDIPYTFSVFMNAPVAPDGGFTIDSARSKPGDYIDLQAEMDCLIAISNCPQELNPVNGPGPSPLKLVVYSGGGAGG
jgi:urea carboxylase-associated protein 1